MKVKEFKDVQIGDTALENNCFEEIGTVTWKGTFEEAKKAGYLSEYEIEEMLEYFDKDEVKGFEYVLVDDPDCIEGPVLMMYDFDPSSAVVKL